MGLSSRRGIQLLFLLPSHALPCFMCNNNFSGMDVLRMPLPLHNLHSPALHVSAMHRYLFHRNIRHNVVHMGRLPVVCVLIDSPSYDMRPCHLYRLLQTGSPLRRDWDTVLNIPPRIVLPRMCMQAHGDMHPRTVLWALLDR
ncbi:hypothetical protein FA13DRAFT_1742225, partial [Coprinellus micaceus]